MEVGWLDAITRVATKEGKLASLRSFLEPGIPGDQSIGVLCRLIETAAARTRQVSGELRKRRVRRDVVIASLHDAAADLAERRVLRARLDTADARELLESMRHLKISTAESLRKTLEFLDLLAAADLPQEFRAALFRGSVKQNLQTYKDLAQRAVKALGEVVSHQESVKIIARLNNQAWVGRDSLDEVSIEKLKGRVERALADEAALEPYLDFLRIESLAKTSKLGPILKHLESTIPAYEHLEDAYDFLFFRSCAEAILAEDAALRSHSGVTHEQLRGRYQQLDRKIMDLRRLGIARKLKEIAIPLGNSTGRFSERTELSLLRHQIGLQRRHVPLRDLFKRAGLAAQALKPCFMMSPMSVAQFLDPSGIRFDLVIMDEASQIRPEDALGAIARGQQLVVVGDPKQLPPTSFFEKVDRDGSTDENSEEAEFTT